MNHRKQKWLFWLLLGVLLPLAAGCSQAADETLAGTVAALAAQNEALATQNAVLATQIAASAVFTPTAAPTETMTETAVPSPTAAAATTATASPSPAVTETAVATSTRPRVTAVAATTAPPPTIYDWYLRDIADVAEGGKRVTFVWRVDNVLPQHEVRIFVGTQQRFQPWWVVAPAGEMTVDLARTIYPDPWATLTVYDTVSRVDLGSWTLTIPWACPIPYFFTGSPGTIYPCASDQPQRGTAAEQFFENGRMLWIQALDTIFVFYGDGQYPQWQSFPDLWVDGDPETDPTITPPANRYQPVRGFNKVWREQAGVRDRLGWGVAPEEIFTVTYQAPEYESAVGAATLYIQMIDGQVRQLYSYDVGSGSWEVIRP